MASPTQPGPSPSSYDPYIPITITYVQSCDLHPANRDPSNPMTTSYHFPKGPRRQPWRKHTWETARAVPWVSWVRGTGSEVARGPEVCPTRKQAELDHEAGLTCQRNVKSTFLRVISSSFSASGLSKRGYQMCGLKVDTRRSRHILRSGYVSPSGAN